jgi:peroxiredoxin
MIPPMRTLLAVVLLAACSAACSSQPQPVEPVPLPPDPEDSTARTPPTENPDGPGTDDPIAPPKDDRAKARGGKLADADGKPVDLATTWAESNVVVVFYRGAWCKICRKNLADLQASYKDLLHAGAHLYAVSVDDQPTAKQMKSELGLEFPVLSDTGGNIARSWGVLDESTNIAKPATFLIARGGAIALQEVGHTPGDQPGGYVLLEKVKQHLPAEGVN